MAVSPAGPRDTRWTTENWLTARMPTDTQSANHGADAYPPDLTGVVLSRWPDVERACGGHVPRPPRRRLEQVLSASYQASLFREEDRPVTFRVALADPSSFDSAAGPPTGLHRPVFGDARPLNAHELGRLSPAAAFSRSFIGARLDGDRAPVIWGLIHSGPNWLQSAYRLCHVAPDVLAVPVSQDGGMRFVRWYCDAVTYWDQVTTGPWDAW